MSLWADQPWMPQWLTVATGSPASRRSPPGPWKGAPGYPRMARRFPSAPRASGRMSPGTQTSHPRRSIWPARGDDARQARDSSERRRGEGGTKSEDPLVTQRHARARDGGRLLGWGGGHRDSGRDRGEGRRGPGPAVGPPALPSPFSVSPLQVLAPPPVPPRSFYPGGRARLP